MSMEPWSKLPVRAYMVVIWSSYRIGRFFGGPILGNKNSGDISEGSSFQGPLYGRCISS